MKVLVINSGSSSLKYQLIDMETESVVAKGNCERIGIDGSKLTHKANGKEVVVETAVPNHNVAVQLVLNELTSGEASVISSMKEIDAVGHRVVASGEAFKKPTLVTPEAMVLMEEIKDLAPLHNPAAIVGVNACRAAMPETPMVLVFDTGFHFTMPDYAYMYAVDYTVRTERVISSFRRKRRNILEKSPRSSRSSPATSATVRRSRQLMAVNAWIRRWASRLLRVFPWAREAVILTMPRRNISQRKRG